uniref:ADP-ribosylglycohydrolase n=1 Tax=Candidatus Kentrum sp. MB TaxID=2138164 RepID=A0A450XKZ1_9GAMM|nr:MAG: hypothetical protein BECKMB1821G_GA0114241_101124 [Candidatus Kentron sp. MB]VFK29818.1 MAG: hypothetical protein BECKMB1821I_GA0114274_101214 [Candidatus Kentron sp. MB]VFK74956.1 MAG: hypothetical protein BECKMB1821H_GA0114242_101314 [Candidatus Kentron sp. MB]
MLGAIAGDIIGSIYEWNNIKTRKFPLFGPKSFFTDDSVLTIALADAILHDKDYGNIMRQYFRRYPHASYGTAHIVNGRQTPTAAPITAGAMVRPCAPAPLVMSSMIWMRFCSRQSTTLP